MEDNNTPEAPSPCTAGCGFYGNKIYNNMCSKCFKEHEDQNKLDIVKQTAANTTINPSTATVPPPPPPSSTATNSTALPHKEHIGTTTTSKTLEEDKKDKVMDDLKNNEQFEVKKDEEKTSAVTIASTEKPVENDEDKKPVQKNKGRCFSCRSKIPLAKQLTNKCRCDYIFCDTHRFPDKHNCTFDHAKNDKDILAKLNPKINDKPRGGNSFQRIDSF